MLDAARKLRESTTTRMQSSTMTEVGEEQLTVDRESKVIVPGFTRGAMTMWPLPIFSLLKEGTMIDE